MGAKRALSVSTFAVMWYSAGCSSEPAPVAGDARVMPTDPDAMSAGALPGPKRVFQFRNGTLGKIRDSAESRPALDVADEDCTRGANELGYGGLWKAWLSSSDTDAIDRIEDVSPWHRLDRETVLFATKEELAHGPRVRIDPGDRSEDVEACEQFGQCIQTFWTGTAMDGRGTNDHCFDWTIYNRPAMATVGRADLAGQGWVADYPLACGAYLALLCIEQ